MMSGQDHVIMLVEFYVDNPFTCNSISIHFANSFNPFLTADNNYLVYPYY